MTRAYVLKISPEISPAPHTLVANKGAYAVTGAASTITHRKWLTAVTGAYSYTGATVDLTGPPSLLTVVINSALDYTGKASFLASGDADNFYEWRESGGGSVQFGTDPVTGTNNVMQLNIPFNESQAGLSLEIPWSNYNNTAQAGAKILHWKWKEYRSSNWDFGAGEKFLRAVSRRGSAFGSLTMDIIPSFFFDVAQTSGNDAVGLIDVGAQSTLIGGSWTFGQVDISSDATYPWIGDQWNDMELYIDSGTHNTADGTVWLKYNGTTILTVNNVLVRRDYDGDPYLFQQIWFGGWWSNGEGSNPSPSTNIRYIKDIWLGAV